MAKISKNAYPEKHTAEDFQCFGPSATKDGEFDNVKIADLGCFNQDGVDSNKYYLASICKSKITNNWYVYFEWGRTGKGKPNFQFIECASEAIAQKEFAKQLHSKNDKRGEWVIIAGIKTLRAKPGKDCYLVRPTAARTTGLPDARKVKVIKVVSSKFDPITAKLLKDLNFATMDYTKGLMANDNLPTQGAIDEARDILTAAKKRIMVVGDDIEDQLKDNEIMQLTNLIYSRIPKVKALHAKPEVWLLTKDNIMSWMTDLDAFESSLSISDDENVIDMPLHMEHIEEKSELGKFLYSWWPNASMNRHTYLGPMKIKNLWKIDRHGDAERLRNSQNKILANMSGKPRERPLSQPAERPDVQEKELFAKSNTSLLFHGSRSCNIVGILQKSFLLPKQLVGVMITGKMYGEGVYKSCDWRKSAGYTSLSGSCWASGSGAISGRNAFMFACDVVLGQPYLAPKPFPYTSPPSGHHCVFGKGGYSGVQNNEWVIFDTNQIRIRYLLEFTA